MRQMFTFLSHFPQYNPFIHPHLPPRKVKGQCLRATPRSYTRENSFSKLTVNQKRLTSFCG